jgi:hypothetical protein
MLSSLQTVLQDVAKYASHYVRRISFSACCLNMIKLEKPHYPKQLELTASRLLL